MRSVAINVPPDLCTNTTCRSKFLSKVPFTVSLVDSAHVQCASHNGLYILLLNLSLVQCIAGRPGLLLETEASVMSPNSKAVAVLVYTVLGVSFLLASLLTTKQLDRFLECQC